VAAAFVAATLAFTAVPAQAHTSSPRDVQSSAYRGKFYNPRYESIRKCIVHRESRGHYGIVNRSSGAAGAYQLMPPLRRYAAKKMGSSWLGNIPANQWSRYNQDRAFYAIVHYEGLKHWRGGNIRCW
jgi:hypothetical protein